jgi:hypothetical protein
MCCPPDALRWSRKADERREASEREASELTGRTATSTREPRRPLREPEQPEEAPGDAEEAFGGDPVACC